MTLKTCLLVTDDPDDHHAVSEALDSVSSRTILLNIIDSQKALLLLKESTYRPDYIMLDLSMHGIKVNSILKAIDESGHQKIPVLVFGSKDSLLQIDQREGLTFLDKEYDYSDLRAFLRNIII